MDKWGWGDQDPMNQRDEWDRREMAPRWEIKFTFKQIVDFFKKLFSKEDK